MAEVVLIHGIDQQHKSADKLEADFGGELNLPASWESIRPCGTATSQST